MTQVAESLFDPTAVRARAGEVVAALSSPGKMIAVEGPAGSGRESLVDRVAELIPDAVVVRVPAGEDADAPLHALLQAAAHLGRSYVAHAADGATPLRERSRAVLSELAHRGCCLVLLLPDRLRRSSEIADDEPTKHWVEKLTSAIREAGQLSFALVAPSRTVESFDAPAVFKRVFLREADANLDALENAAVWGVFADHARRLRAELLHHPRALGPLQVRLMVGLVALGVPLATVVQSVPGNNAASLAPLVSLYVEELRQEHRAETRAAVRRFLLPRVPLHTSDALAVAADGTEEGDALLRYCLAYGDSRLRTPSYVRNTLLQRLARTGDEASTHHEIAKLHKSYDGALSPEEAAGRSRGQLDHWLEKVHHLAHSGHLGAREWSEQKLGSREFLIDRARGLSIEHHEYVEAANLYERCLELWAEDAYALHYRGFNLDRAGEDAPTVEKCYRAALVNERTNLYYNSRLVTFLVEQGRPLDADKAWQAALDNVSSRTPREVAYHITLHVVIAWLDAGDLRRARMAFDTLPPSEEFEWGAPLERLRHRLLDAEEADALGVAVYPASFPMDRRWKYPRLAQPAAGGRPRTDWYPGRVVSVEDGHVVFAWVNPALDPHNRSVFTREVTHDEWQQLAGQLPGDALRFIEIAEYQGLEEPLLFIDPSPPDAPIPASTPGAPHPLRYLAKPIAGSVLG